MSQTTSMSFVIHSPSLPDILHVTQGNMNTMELTYLLMGWTPWCNLQIIPSKLCRFLIGGSMSPVAMQGNTAVIYRFSNCVVRTMIEFCLYCEFQKVLCQNRQGVHPYYLQSSHMESLNSPVYTGHFDKTAILSSFRLHIAPWMSWLKKRSYF